MVASFSSMDADIGEKGVTVQLFEWISQVRTKKIKWLRSRRRNIRVEAVLAHALSKAERELHSKQIARNRAWQSLKKQIAQKEMSNNNIGRETNQSEMNHKGESDENIWSTSLYPELSSLDDFMSQLSEIKAPIQR